MIGLVMARDQKPNVHKPEMLIVRVLPMAASCASHAEVFRPST